MPDADLETSDELTAPANTARVRSQGGKSERRAPQRFQAPIGTRDLLSPEAERRRAFIERFAEICQTASYGEIATPIFEELGVFLRVGESTDVVTKEMYDFEDKGGRRMALRPELTAGVCRAFAQHRPQTLPWKVFYAGPQFRYEAPQKGRYRQFDQVGIEALGAFDPDLDSEVIWLAWTFLARLGLQKLDLQLNSLGESEERVAYSTALEAYFRAHVGDLSEQSQATLTRNPMRVLDSKRREDRPIIAGAPIISEFLSDRSAAYFDRVCQNLSRLEVPFTLNPGLVRGLDYYRQTTFEIVSSAFDSAQNAVGGGGRYDGLVESLGGPSTPGVGFAIGIDRTLLACDAESVFPAPVPQPDVFLVDTDGSGVGLGLMAKLRSAGLRVDSAPAQGFEAEGRALRSMKAQMKAAGRSGAAIALILGSDEVASNSATVRQMDGGEQAVVPAAELIDVVVRMVSEPTAGESAETL